MKKSKVLEWVKGFEKTPEKSSEKEQGRSMVEMLGVLAIIGVLSIGGIAGYTMAMNRHKANQILDFASKLSVAAQAGAASNPDNWSVSVNALAEEEGYTISHYVPGAVIVGGDFYEVTGLYVYEDGQVEGFFDNGKGIAKVVQSITGRNDAVLVEAAE